MNHGSVSRAAWPAIRAGTAAICLIAVVTVGTAPALATTGGNRHGRRAACNSHRRGATKVTSTVIVYRRRAGLDAFGGELSKYFACARPDGRSVQIGQSDTSGGEYPAQYDMSHLTVSGAYVADVGTSGFADASSCAKYDPTADCGASIVASVQVADARTRRRLQTAPSFDISAVALSKRGAVAWAQLPTDTSTSQTLSAIVLHPGAPRRLTGTVQTLDGGAIGSLSFRGLTLSWNNEGQVKSQTL